MVIVYFKSGEKAPMPDANYVKVELATDGSGIMMLRCYFGQSEVGVFKWDEVAGYTVSAVSSADLSPAHAYAAWGQRIEA